MFLIKSLITGRILIFNERSGPVRSGPGPGSGPGTRDTLRTVVRSCGAEPPDLRLRLRLLRPSAILPLPPRSSANFLARKSRAHANRGRASGLPNNNSAVSVGTCARRLRRAPPVSAASRRSRLDQYPSLGVCPRTPAGRPLPRRPGLN